MITFTQSKEIALCEKNGLVITSAVQYKNYYVFFMQPKDVLLLSEGALLDSYVFVNFETGEVEYNSVLMFKDFFDNAKPVSL